MNRGPETIFSLKGRVAIVTGAGGQLGGEYVRTLLDAGAAVAALDIDIDPDNPRAGLRGIDSPNMIIVRADITDKGSLEQGLQKITEHLGCPSVLVNNAALDAPPHAGEQDTGPFETYPEASWDMMMDVNLKGMFLSCQVFGGFMAGTGAGSIINISSVYGILSPDQRIYKYRPEPFFKPVTYSVSKAGVLNLTRYLATYWAHKGVRVNTLTLGGVFNRQDEIFVNNYSQKVPLGRMADQNEYNGAILFLASDASSYMTGSNLIVDGGFSCW